MRAMAHAIPELLEPIQAVARPVAGDQPRVDGADRRADYPVGLDPGFAEALIDAGLIGAERAAALEDQDGLAHRLGAPRNVRVLFNRRHVVHWVVSMSMGSV